MIFNEKNMLGMYLSILVLCKYVGKYLVGYKYTSKSCILYFTLLFIVLPTWY